MTATPLPPHVISTDHPNYPSEGWSIAEMVWIDARDKIFQAYATQARADLEAENKRLREALRLIEHATAPTHDDGAYHENAYELARAALKDEK